MADCASTASCSRGSSSETLARSAPRGAHQGERAALGSLSASAHPAPAIEAGERGFGAALSCLRSDARDEAGKRDFQLAPGERDHVCLVLPGR